MNISFYCFPLSIYTIGKTSDRGQNRCNDESGKFKCCGGNPYNSAFQTCCNGRVSQGSRLKCCGSVAYDGRFSICCEKNLFSRRNGRNTCCGSNAIRYPKELCCKGIVTPVPYPSTFMVNPGCCKGKVYDMSKEICCSGYIRQRMFRNNRCCGKKVIDAKAHACCNGQATSKKTGKLVTK